MYLKPKQKKETQKKRNEKLNSINLQRRVQTWECKIKPNYNIAFLFQPTKKTQTGASKLNIFRPHFRSPPTKKSMPHHLPHPKRCIQN